MCVFLIFLFQFANSSGVQLTKLATLPQSQEGLQGCTGAGCVREVIQKETQVDFWITYVFVEGEF